MVNDVLFYYMWDSVACVITDIISILTGQSTNEETNYTWYEVLATVLGVNTAS